MSTLAAAGLAPRRMAGSGPVPHGPRRDSQRRARDSLQLIGNQTLQRLRAGSSHPIGVAVGHPGDTREREADELADRLMGSGRGGRGVALRSGRTGGVHAGVLTDERLLRELREADSGGAPLGEDQRARLPGPLGPGVESVRIHRDETADRLSRRLGARAFTRGNHIFFRRGAYDPEGSDGKRLLLHELAHVGQQAEGVGDEAIRRTPFGVGVLLDSLPGTTPMRVRVLGCYPSSAIAEELYGDASVPLTRVRSAQGVDVVQVDAGRLLPRWRPYFRPGPSDDVIGLSAEEREAIAWDSFLQELPRELAWAMLILALGILACAVVVSVVIAACPPAWVPSITAIIGLISGILGLIFVTNGIASGVAAWAGYQTRLQEASTRGDLETAGHTLAREMAQAAAEFLGGLLAFFGALRISFGGGGAGGRAGWLGRGLSRRWRNYLAARALRWFIASLEGTGQGIRTVVEPPVATSPVSAPTSPGAGRLVSPRAAPPVTPAEAPVPQTAVAPPSSPAPAAPTASAPLLQPGSVSAGAAVGTPLAGAVTEAIQVPGGGTGAVAEPAAEPAAEVAQVGEDTRALFSPVYAELLAQGHQAVGPDQAIFPDPALPTLEIRPNGDIMGNYQDVLGWLQQAQVSYDVQAHHIFEDHFAAEFGIPRQAGRSVALLQEEHAQFTAEMGRIVRRGTTREDVDLLYQAHVQMYQNLGHPEWIVELRSVLRQYRDVIRQRYAQGQVPGADAPDFPQRRQRVYEFLDNLDAGGD